MKASHVEGLASHDDPESCTGGREGAREALTGARTGGASELRNVTPASGAPTPCPSAEGPIGRLDWARDGWAPRSQRPQACMETSRTGAGRFPGCLLRPRQTASERPRTYADDARAGEVGPPRSIVEAAEQGRGTGRGGGGREGSGPRGTRPSATRPGRSAGPTRPARSSGYVRQPSRTGNSGSPRCCTTSTT